MGMFRSFIAFFKYLGLAILVALLMTLLSAIPPISILYDWLMHHNLRSAWFGLMSCVIALCLSLYTANKKTKK